MIYFTAKDLPPSILKGPEEESKGIENKTHSLQCEVAADKTVEILWYKENELILKTAEGYNYLDDGGLQMTNIQRSFEGNYHCTATTRYGTTKSDKGLFKVICKFCVKYSNIVR